MRHVCVLQGEVVNPEAAELHATSSIHSAALTPDTNRHNFSRMLFVDQVPDVCPSELNSSSFHCEIEFIEDVMNYLARSLLS